MTTFQVYEHRWSEVVGRVEVANLKAWRLGIPQQFELVNEQHWVETRANAFGIQELVRYASAELNFDTLSYGGWSFVATLDWDREAGLIVRTAPGQELVRRPEECVCEHCHTRRERSTTYWLRHEDGREIQVGSSCIQAFLGFSPELWVLEFDPSEGLLYEDDCYGEGRREEVRWSTDQVLRLVAALAHREGYVSKAQASARQVGSTAERMRFYLTPATNEEAKELRELLEIANGDANVILAATIREFARTMSGDSEYATNMRQLMRAETFSPKHLGFVVSAYGVWQRHQEEEAQRLGVQSKHLGELGKKLTVTGKVVGNKVIYGQYGPTMLVVLDVDGDVVKWFASGEHEFEIGDTLTLCGAVKAHGEYNGKLETQLTRCKVL